MRTIHFSHELSVIRNSCLVCLVVQALAATKAAIKCVKTAEQCHTQSCGLSPLWLPVALDCSLQTFLIKQLDANFWKLFPKLMHVYAECEIGVKFLSYYIKILNSFQLCSNILLIWNYLDWWCCSCDVFNFKKVKFIGRDDLFDLTWERSCLHENLTISKSLSLLSTRN